jgi:hypothetical protein
VSATGEDWVSERVLPRAHASDSAGDLLARFRREAPDAYDRIRASYGGSDPDDVMRRTVARRLTQRSEYAYTVRLVDDLRGRSATDRAIPGVTSVRYDCLASEPGGPAYVLDESRTGAMVLHLAGPPAGTWRTRRRRSDEIVGTVSAEWQEVGEELYYPESGSVEGRVR